MALKDFMQSIFNEDIDVEEEMEELEEQELEEEYEEEEYVEPAPEPVQQPVQPTVQPIQQTFVQPVSEQPVYTQPQQPKKPESFGSLNVDDVSRRDPSTKKKRTYRYDRRKIQQPRTHKTVEVEYQSIMSPIFGNVKDDQKDFNKVHNAIDLDKPVESDDLVKVISPMYGSSIPGYKPVDKIPVKQPDPNVTPEEPEAIDLSDMLEKTKDTVAHQEKLFASKN
ncbi:MAG: hypothetical protein J6E46_05070 [Faecalicoccus sp.]|nr:hypothetical protein [Faecalicoccus sp.]